MPVTSFKEHLKSLFVSNICFILDFSIQVRQDCKNYFQVWHYLAHHFQCDTAHHGHSLPVCLWPMKQWLFVLQLTTTQSSLAVIYNVFLLLWWHLDVWQVVTLAACHFITLLNFANSRSMMKCLHLLHHLSFLWPVLSDMGMPFSARLQSVSRYVTKMFQ